VSDRLDSAEDETLEVTTSELRALNEELNTKTNRLELAWEAARGGVFEHRIPIDDSTYISEQWAQVLGYRLEDLPSYEHLLEWLSEQAHPQDRQRWEHTYNTLIEGKANRYSIELRFRHRSGRWIWVRKIAKVIDRDEDGSPSHLLRMMIDITDLKQVEDSLKESEYRFRTLASNISQLAWMADEQGRISWYNRRWYEYTGTSAEEMEGLGWQSVYHPHHLGRVVDKLTACFAAGEPWEDTFPLRGVDGNYRWFLARAVPIVDEDGQVTRWFGTNTDVTHLREVEEKLVEADRQKDEFLAMLGHELRNPLAAIRTASELLRLNAEGNPRIAQAQQVLERQTAHMSKLLDGLLDVSRIIRGKIRLEREAVDFGAVCAEVAIDIAGSSASRDLAITTDLPPETLWVNADRVRLAQIVSNLLSNAVKFTLDGGLVTLSLRKDNDRAVLVVRDSGIGIEQDLLPHVFEVFRQSTQSIDRSHGGLGLGLALVRTLTVLHGGTIEAASEGLGRGAAFTFSLPLSSIRPHASTRPPPSDGRTLRILIIEDNEDAAEMLQQLLQRAGHDVTVAHSGKEGVSSAGDLLPDAILCDLGLPGMSGFEVAQELRRDANLADTALIAISGYGRPEDKAQALAAGFDIHMTKPVDVTTLEKVFARLTVASSTEAGPISPTPA